mmetsp:Transcript_11824/g.17349  ORF Transcript_11824/g.17349 Transcript_11824/m.17349 type:complete len:352 (+) Transcript_11824:187-1242(+)
MPAIPLAQLPLRPSTLLIFQKRGFSTVKEVEEAKANGGISNLSEELGLSLAQTAVLVREIKSASASTETQGSTALSLLQSRKQRSIITFSKSVDNMLGGGISLGELTEVCGLPGAGKTQLAMQLCVNSSIPEMVGGVCGQAIYIDTEGSFSPERCRSMAQALVKHVQKSSKNKKLPDWFEFDAILNGIHVFRVYDEATQVAVMHSLPQYLEKHQQSPRPIRLIVLDSIAFHYRSTTSDYLGRTKSLSDTASLLSDIGSKYNTAVVVINHMTTKINGGISQVVPALGESWAHAVTTRLILASDEQTIRTCRLVKSPHKAYAVAQCEVRECGIRDAMTADQQNQDRKRQRVHA